MIDIGPNFLSTPSALMTVILGLKMLKFSVKFLRPHYFLTLSLNWFIFGLIKIPSPHPRPPLPDAELKIVANSMHLVIWSCGFPTLLGPSIVILLLPLLQDYFAHFLKHDTDVTNGGF